MTSLPNPISTSSPLMRLSCCIPILAALSLSLGPVLQAQTPAGPPPTSHFHGLLNDYTPSTVSKGPYEMRGTWSLDLYQRPFENYADFTATFNMETSDYGVNTGVVDPTMPPTRGAHTHTISLTHAMFSTDTSHCPTYNPATTGAVLVVTGQPQIITGNGSPAPFQVTGPTTLWICLAGGDQISYSNFAMTFADGPATTHFGTYAIHGVVLKDNDHH